MTWRRAAARGIAATAVVALLLAAIALAGPEVGAQERTTSSTVAELPPAEIIPRPDSGHEPTEAGDRGGSLQLLVLGLVVTAIGAGVAKVVHDSRRARSGGDGPS